MYHRKSTRWNEIDTYLYIYIYRRCTRPRQGRYIYVYIIDRCPQPSSFVLYRERKACDSSQRMCARVDSTLGYIAYYKKPIGSHTHTYIYIYIYSRRSSRVRQPYLRLQCGTVKINDRANKKSTNQNDPTFHKMFSLDARLPGASRLVVSVWNYERTGLDTFLGETVIDLEDRWFHPVWQSTSIHFYRYIIYISIDRSISILYRS